MHEPSLTLAAYQSDDGSSDDDDEVTERGLALREETIWERLSALRDIVPPSTRHRIASNLSTASTYVYVGGRLVGGLAWVVTTSALLVGLPYALAVEDEVRVAMQEREIAAQQSGAQHVSVLGELILPSLLFLALPVHADSCRR